MRKKEYDEKKDLEIKKIDKSCQQDKKLQENDLKDKCE